VSTFQEETRLVFEWLGDELLFRKSLFSTTITVGVDLITLQLQRSYPYMVVLSVRLFMATVGL
jgi:hypothetical protein